MCGFILTLILSVCVFGRQAYNKKGVKVAIFYVSFMAINSLCNFVLNTDCNKGVRWSRLKRMIIEMHWAFYGINWSRRYERWLRINRNTNAIAEENVKVQQLTPCLAFRFYVKLRSVYLIQFLVFFKEPLHHCSRFTI